MKRYFAVYLFVLSLLFTSKAYVLETQDQGKIESIIKGYVHAWNHNKGRGFTNNFSEDASFVNIFGIDFLGKEKIQERHNQIHDSFLKDSIFEVTDLKLREVNPSLVITLVRWKVDGFRKPGTDVKETIYGIFSHTFVKTEDKWEIIACQNTLKKN
ncbi:hypothetical protein COB11_03510 [Candidatus Aerophobetes bacterium]|uniref:DUF4440 domain-containing protein n=1 Tax=Aerophobetes bacterium TaxID=2030807 RepID=A0A2A4YIR0_UNCAE|nr:MAG: hypothetical protein COB11_03510 [Candidatus Aerophobetes bacterium]